MFKDYPTDPMYMVNEKGDVLSRFTGRLLKPYLAANGYCHVNVRNKRGERCAKPIHRLVAETFLEPEEGKTHVNHKDSNKLNNSVENLEWCTNAENRAHSVSSGTHSHGEDHTGAKLTNEIVDAICQMLEAGWIYSDVRDTVDAVYETTLSRASYLNIRGRRTWKHISSQYEWPKKNTANKLSGRATTISQESTPK